MVNGATKNLNSGEHPNVKNLDKSMFRFYTFKHIGNQSSDIKLGYKIYICFIIRLLRYLMMPRPLMLRKRRVKTNKLKPYRSIKYALNPVPDKFLIYIVTERKIASTTGDIGKQKIRMLII